MPNSTLNKLTQRSDLRGTLLVTFHFALLTVTGTVALVCAIHEYWLAFLLLLVMHGAMFSFLGYAGMGHELSHRTVFASREPNDLMFVLVSFLTWNNHQYFRKSHTVHHQFTVHDGIDGEVKLPQVSVLTQWPHLVFFDAPLFWRSLSIVGQNACGMVKGDFGQRHFPEGSADRSQLATWARIMMLGHSALAVLFVVAGWWPLIFVVTLAPFFGTFMNRLLAQGQHYGMTANTDDFRKAARTVVLHPFLAFLYWQMNYHLEHHMYPAVPFYQLRRLHDLIAADLPPPTRGVWALVRLMRMKEHGA